MIDQDILEGWLEAVTHMGAEDFTYFTDTGTFDAATWMEAKVWADCFFRPDANPFLEANAARHGYHVSRPDSYDFLRHEYDYHGIAVVVTETANFSCTRAARPGIELLQLDDRRTYIDSLARELLRMEDEALDPWRFQYPPTIDEGAVFSTNPDAGLFALKGWRARADGIISGGVVHFFCYRKMLQYIGLRDDQHWFGEPFRARAQGRAPG